MIFGNTTNTASRFSFKQYNLFYTVQKHEICPFMETVPYDRERKRQTHRKDKNSCFQIYIKTQTGYFVLQGFKSNESCTNMYEIYIVS